jgi:hypothetical protein
MSPGTFLISCSVFCMTRTHFDVLTKDSKDPAEDFAGFDLTQGLAEMRELLDDLEQKGYLNH